MDELSEIAEELEPSTETTVAEQEDVADIAQAIEEAAGEEADEIDKEVEAALDISDPDDDDDEEFNLEDFDIGEIDEPPSDKK